MYFFFRFSYKKTNSLPQITISAKSIADYRQRCCHPMNSGNGKIQILSSSHDSYLELREDGLNLWTIKGLMKFSMKKLFLLS